MNWWGLTLLYDLIIVGGGPAGATAAIYAARHGLTTLLLDKSRFPRDKVCGDAIGDKAVDILHDLQLDKAVANLAGLRFSKVLLGSSNHDEAEFDLSRAVKGKFVGGYMIRRQVFDAFLFDHARAVTTTSLEGFAVDDVIWENGSVCGVVGLDKTSGLRREFRARMVIGADGYRSVVARKVGKYAINPAHWLVSVRRYYRNVAGPTDRIELHYVSGVTPGYFWIFPLPDGLFNVGIGMLSSAMKRKRVNLPEALDTTLRDRFFAPRFADAVPTEKPVGWHLPVGSLHRPCCGPGYLLAGDAAGLIDPFTGEGIANAMFSGRVAAAQAAAAVATGDVSALSLAGYDRELWAGIGEALKISTRLQKVVSIRSLWNFTIRKAARNPDVKDAIGAMIADEHSRERMTRAMFYLKLLAA